MNNFIDEILAPTSSYNYEWDSEISMDDGIQSQEDVRQLQRMLNAMFNFQLKIDGDLGKISSKSKSREAIELFQGLANLPVTRKADRQTVNRLKFLLPKQLPEIQRFYFFKKFGYDEFTFKKEHIKELCELKNKIYYFIRRRKIDTIFFTGHADKRGKEKYNKTLGENRAHEVIRHLLTAWRCDKRLKIDLTTLFVRYYGLGERHLIAAAPHEDNRRVEAILLKMNR